MPNGTASGGASEDGRDRRFGRPSLGVPAVGGMVSRGGSAATTLLGGLGFWSAIVLPVVAVGLLVSRPAGWQAMVAVLFALDAAALLIGHCHGREC